MRIVRETEIIQELAGGSFIRVARIREETQKLEKTTDRGLQKDGRVEQITAGK